VALQSYRVQLSAQVEVALDAESSELEKLKNKSTSKPDEFANRPRVIVYVAVNDLLESFSNHPYRHANKAKDPDDPAFLYADTYGWRFIIKIDPGAKIVEVYYLSRLTDPATPAEETLKELRGST
jgi:hypothetical protein